VVAVVGVVVVAVRRPAVLRPDILSGLFQLPPRIPRFEPSMNALYLSIIYDFFQYNLLHFFPECSCLRVLGKSGQRCYMLLIFFLRPGAGC